MADDEQPTSRLGRFDPITYIMGAAILIVAVVAVVALVARSDSHPAQTSTVVGHHMQPSHVMPHARRGELNVDIGDFWFKPSAHHLHAGVYRFTAHNYGATQHDIMVERVPIEMSAPGQPIDEAAPYGLDDMQPGMTKHTEIMLSAGRWELFCSVGGHYQAGQHQIITVYGHMPRGMRAPKSMGMDEDSGGGMGM